jgi:glycosyltransferase involved in cell wall biosynthesis
VTVFGFLSTFPPTRCGLATFTESLADAIAESGGPDSRIVRVDDLVPTGPATPSVGTRVVGDLRPHSRVSRVAAARALNACDVVVVQHEFGIFGGPDGDEILDVLARINSPTVVVLHTVRASPSAHQRWLIDRIGGVASALVVMTQAARELLAARYSVPMANVWVIPHGVPESLPAPAPDPGSRPVILTWGLIGPGKGIEWGIRALTELSDLTPRPVYRIAGQTHPKVVAAAGESYRKWLVTLAGNLGVTADVEIDGRYRDGPELARLVAAADIVLLPYDSREQTTSGVLVEAIAAGKPVIATRFPHAVELLADGAGLIVAQGDAHAIAVGIRALLGRGGIAARRVIAEHATLSETAWSAVAAQYRRLATTLVDASAA